MAKGRSSRGSAQGTPSSLTSLLSPSIKTTRAAVSPNTLSFLQPSILAERNYVLANTTPRNRYIPPSPPPGRPRLRPASATNRLASRITISPLGTVSPSGYFLNPGLAFNIPRRVGICVRRKIRREILHALKLTHKSGRGGSHRRRNSFTGIKC